MAAGNLDDAFFAALPDAADALGVPPSWLLTAIYIESRFNPQAHRAGSDFWGMTQINGPDVRKYSNLSPPDYLALPASGQLPTVVAWYRSALAFLRRPPRSPGVFYAANLAPGNLAARGDAPSAVLYAAPSREYRANAGLDVNKDGAITVGDLDAFAYALTTTGPEAGPFKAALQRGPYVPPYSAGEPGVPNVSDPKALTGWNVGVPIALGAGIGAVLAAGAVALHERADRAHARRNPPDRNLLFAGGALVAGGLAAALVLAGRNTSSGPAALPVRTGLTVFPILDVPGANIHFTDDFGAPRGGGTRRHAGNDLFAVEGTPVIAPAAGGVTFLADGAPDSAGRPGLSFHLVDDVGTFYFGTHLKGFEGKDRRVTAGEIIGYVGHTGNANDLPASYRNHLHFEIHPNRGAAVNPYPLILHLPRLTQAAA